MLHNTYSKCVKMSMSLIHRMVPLLEIVLDMVWGGDKECVHICVYIRTCEL